MEMETVKIVRLEQTSQGALGSMILFGHLFCTTLEPDNNDSDRFQIPEGTYFCKRFSGVKYKNTFEIIVPGHTALLFHAGNIEAHTEGCILMGQYPGKLVNDRAVLNSGNTFKKFMAILQGVDSFYASFKDCY
jgi:hypothetical protein